MSGTDWSELEAGASNCEEIELMNAAANGYDEYSGLFPGQAARLAAELLTETEGERYDKLTDKPGDPVPRRNRHLNGYGRRP